MRELANMGFGLMQGVRRRLVVTQLADMLGVSDRDIEQAIPEVRRATPRPAEQQQDASSGIDDEQATIDPAMVAPLAGPRHDADASGS
jgi:hypothetical protein